MFLLKTPIATASIGRFEGRQQLAEMEMIGEFPTLEDAVHAAIRANLDLETTIIEKNGAGHTVNGWITCRIAGGCCSAG